MLVGDLTFLYGWLSTKTPHTPQSIHTNDTQIHSRRWAKMGDRGTSYDYDMMNYTHGDIKNTISQKIGIIGWRN